MSSLYLISPKAPHSVSYDSEPGWVSSPDLAVVTIAAMVPSGWAVAVTEEAIDAVDFETESVFIGLTGKSAHLSRIIELSREFRLRGKVVIIGGPLASLDPEALRPHADILVTGEMEDIAPQLFADLEAGHWRDHYEGGRADIRLSPVPAWHLYPTDRAFAGALQTTRGCPFDCEFCDVIRYQGRKQRHKDVPQVMAELDALHKAGFREVFLSDDNFSVHRQFARAMLDAFIDWNGRHADAPMRFITQTSLDLARDADMLKRYAAAGLHKVFLGIETINEASLRETNKKQNLLLPMKQAVENIASNGIAMRGGIIVGFDHDGPDIFSALYEFLQDSPLPDVFVTILTASKGTPLHDRMKNEGRLLEGRWQGDLLAGNIAPKLMSRDQLRHGARMLLNDLFKADAFEQRVMNFVRVVGPESAHITKRSRANDERGKVMMRWLKRISARGVAEKAMLTRVFDAATEKPAAFTGVLSALMHFERVRSMLSDLDQETTATAASVS